MESYLKKDDKVLHDAIHSEMANKNPQSILCNRRLSLLPKIRQKIGSIEGVAAEGWVRGGLPSREMTRDNDYFERRNKLKKI